jgi:polar amino acid transport system permease protein
MLAVITTMTSLFFGTIVAILRMSRYRFFRGISKLYVEIFRNIPGLFWLLFFYFAFPELLPFDWGERLNANPHYAFIAAILGLTFDNAAYVSDIVRAGVMSIPGGQREAAAATGLNRFQQWSHVVLPLAFRNILPPLGTRMIHNFKNTSLAMVIGVQELTWSTQQIESITFRGVEATTLATLFYICLSMTLAAILIRVEKYLAVNTASIKQVGN